MSERDDVIAGRYRLLDPVGSGGMGSVWRGRDELLERTVAVKQLHVEPEVPEERREIRHQRAMREARITARLHHQHAVPVFDAVEHQGRPYLIMQYFPSQSLQQALAEHTTLPTTVVARIGSEVASALAAAHRVGVVHRDVKPGNVLLAADGTAKITDFGIAHVLGDATLTSRGVITGTPAYLAPEVARGERSSEASDVYALGATLYRALEGHPPVPPQENPLALLHLVASGAITPPERSAELTPVLLRMLAFDPADRPTMDEVARVLREPGEASHVPPGPATGSRAGPDPAAPAGAGAAEEAAGVSTLTLTRTAAQPTAAEPTAAQAQVEPGESAVGTEPSAADLRPSARPPSEAGTPPDGGGEDRTWAKVLGVLALAAVLVAVILLVDRQTRRGESPLAGSTTALSSEVGTADEPGGPAPSADGPGTTANAASSATDAPSATAGAPSSTAGSPSTTVGASSTAPSAGPTQPGTSAPAASGPALAAAQAEQAIGHYYDLLPEDRDAGWALLTDRYQRTTARSRSTYEAFWGSIDTVTVSDAQGSASGSVTATVTYGFADGRTYIERTSYQLVAQDGVLKIDQSTVLSSSRR